MDISNYNIEQCDAVSVLNAILDVYDKPTAKQVTLQQGISQILAAMPLCPTVQQIQSGLAKTSDISTSQAAIIAAVQANAGIPTETIPSTTSSQELAPNTLYVFAERSTNLTLTLGTPITGIANEYHCFIIVGSTAPTITWPTGISWNGGDAPTIAADKTYEISILNNVAAFFEI